MTPKQLKLLTTKELLISYKNKARCFYCENKSISIYNELKNRINKEILYNIMLAKWHMDNGEGCNEFDIECDKLINTL